MVSGVLALSIAARSSQAQELNAVAKASEKQARKAVVDEVEREQYERLNRGRTDPSKTPGFLLSALAMDINHPGQDEAVAEWLKVYPTASDVDRYYHAHTAVFIMQWVSGRGGLIDVSNERWILQAKGPESAHRPLTEPSREVISQALDLQPHNHVTDDDFMETMRNMAADTSLDQTLRTKVQRVLDLPMPVAEKELNDHVKELREQTDVFSAEVQTNNVKLDVSRQERQHAKARLKVLLPLISAEYAESSDYARRDVAAKILTETDRLMYLKIPSAESLYRQVLDSVPISWADNHLVTSIDFGYFCHIKAYRSAENILKKLIAMEIFCEDNSFSLEEDWCWLADTRIKLGRRSEAKDALAKALPLCQEIERDFKTRHLQTDAIYSYYNTLHGQLYPDAKR